MKRTSPTKHATSSPVPAEPTLSKPEPIQLQASTQLLSLEAIEGLVPLSDTPDTLCEKFTQLITLPRDPKTDMRSKIERDFFLFAFSWSINQGMHTEEIYLFLGLINDLYHLLEQESATKEGILSELEDKLKGVGVEGYIGGLSEMREEVMKNIIEFVSISLIQHFDLYRFVLTEEREEQVHSEEIEIETLPDFSTMKIAPLDESVPASFFDKFINPQPLPPPIIDHKEIVSEGKDIVPESKEVENETGNKESEEEITAIFKKLPPEKIKKALNIAQERVVEEFKNEMKEKWNAKELAYQARIKKIESKIKN